ncbi:nuclear transport factor 2 family protein [Streptomyces sp. NPDC002845]
MVAPTRRSRICTQPAPLRGRRTAARSSTSPRSTTSTTPPSPGGSAGLREQFTSLFQQFPDLIVERKRVIAHGDIVAIHAHYRLSPDDRGQAVVDIFRVGRNGKIVEHWDAIRDVPAESANDSTMF